MSEQLREMANNIDWTNTVETYKFSHFVTDHPFSIHQIMDMIYYIINDIKKTETTIKHLKEENTNLDVSSLEYERDYAKSILGLVDRPDANDYKFYQKYQERKKQKGCD